MIYLKIIILLCFCFLSSACSKDDIPIPVKAKIVSSSGNGYEYKEVTFRTLTNPKKMDGQFAVIKGNASLDISSDAEEIIISDDPDRIYLNKGEDVSLNYTIKNGSIISKDFDSLAMLSIYYNFETTMLFWQEHMGLDPADFGKLRLFYNPKLEGSADGTNVTATAKLNAAFLPGPRDFWFFKTSGIEEIPINMNFGILAHEFSHGIFDYYFAQKSAEFYKTEEPESEYILRAINEGLADYFSWMVTGNTNEIIESLSILEDERKIPVSYTLKEYEDAVNNLSGDNVCQGEHYCVGSVIASSLYEIANLDGNNNITVGKAVIASLVELRDDWVANEDDIFDLSFLVNRIYNNLENNKLESCDIFKKWINTTALLGKISC